jgi:replicative DNA helicase
MQTNEKLLCNHEAEQIILGALITDESMFFCDVEYALEPTDFFDKVHEQIFNAILVLKKKNISVNYISVLQQILGTDESLGKEIEEKNYLQKLIGLAIVTFEIKNHVKNIKDLAIKRNLAKTLKKHAEKINTSFERDALECIDECESDLFKLASSKKNDFGFKKISAIVKKTIAKINEENKREEIGVATGLTSLDDALNGLLGGELVVIAARPGMGKTTLILNIAYNIAKSSKATAIFSLEMRDEELVKKLACIINNDLDNVNKIYSIAKTQDEKYAVMTAMKKTEEETEITPLFISDLGGVSIGDIKQYARRLKRKYDLSVLFIDYLQLIKTQSKMQNRNLEIQEITQALKVLAKELDIPIILLSQLSREVEKRADKRPYLSDLRDSGAIEQDADIVLFLYRDNYYQKQRKVLEEIEIIVAKNRKGETGTVKLGFRPSRSFFCNFLG